MNIEGNTERLVGRLGGRKGVAIAAVAAVSLGVLAVPTFASSQNSVNRPTVQVAEVTIPTTELQIETAVAEPAAGTPLTEVPVEPVMTDVEAGVETTLAPVVETMVVGPQLPTKVVAQQPAPKARTVPTPAATVAPRLNVWPFRFKWDSLNLLVPRLTIPPTNTTPPVSTTPPGSTTPTLAPTIPVQPPASEPTSPVPTTPPASTAPVQPPASDPVTPIDPPAPEPETPVDPPVSEPENPVDPPATDPVTPVDPPEHAPFAVSEYVSYSEMYHHPVDGLYRLVHIEYPLATFTAQELCDLYIEVLQADGWTPLEEGCPDDQQADGFMFGMERNGWGGTSNIWNAGFSGWVDADMQTIFVSVILEKRLPPLLESDVPFAVSGYSNFYGSSHEIFDDPSNFSRSFLMTYENDEGLCLAYVDAAEGAGWSTSDVTCDESVEVPYFNISSGTEQGRVSFFDQFDGRVGVNLWLYPTTGVVSTE